MEILVDNKTRSSKIEVDSENDALLLSTTLNNFDKIIKSSWAIVEIDGKDFCITSMVRVDFHIFNSNFSIIPLTKELLYSFISECQIALRKTEEGSEDESFWAIKIVKIVKLLSHY